MNYSRRNGRRFSEKRRFSVVTWLIAINVIVYLFFFLFRIINKLTLENLLENEITKYFVITPSNIFQGDFLTSLVLHMFTHLIFIHLAINMFVLFSLGGLCEKIIGRKRFFWFYLISGLFAGILSALLAGFFGGSELGAKIFSDPTIAMMGASGAIFAIAGLYVVLLPRLKFMVLFLPFFSLPAYIMIPLVLFGFWIASIIFGLPIGNVAHFGGFLAGIIYGLYLRIKYARKIEKLQKMFR